MPNCKKCGKHFPYRKKIDGKIRNLQNRKFCLDCSPFGSHNTKSDDPNRETKRDKNGNKKYSDYTEQEKEENRARQYYYRLKRQLELKDYKGGKCENCGYDKCIKALEFHHLDPNEKDFDLSSRTLLSHSIEEAKKEADKCILLCANCHREEHAKNNNSKYRDLIKTMYDFDIIDDVLKK